MNYKLPLFTVDDDGDLAFKHFYYTNNIPQLNSTIVYMQEGEDGDYKRRIYYKVVDILYPTVKQDEKDLKEFVSSPVLHCQILVDEPVNDWI